MIGFGSVGSCQMGGLWKSIFALIFAKWLYWILNRVKKSEVWWIVCCWVSSIDFWFFVCCKCRKLFGITRNKVLCDSSF